MGGAPSNYIHPYGEQKINKLNNKKSIYGKENK